MNFHCKKTFRLIPLCLALVAGTAFAVDMRDIISGALSEGEASGELTGQAAMKIMEMTQSIEPVKVKAIVVKRFEKTGCARIKVGVRQERVPDIKGNFVPYETAFEMNLCDDGSAPEGGVLPAISSSAPPAAGNATAVKVPAKK